MQNNGLLDSFCRFWAILLQTLGVQVYPARAYALIPPLVLRSLQAKAPPPPPRLVAQGGSRWRLGPSSMQAGCSQYAPSENPLLPRHHSQVRTWLSWGLFGVCFGGGKVGVLLGSVKLVVSKNAL